MSSLEAFSPCSDHGHQRGTNILGEKSIPWVLIPITGIHIIKSTAQYHPKELYKIVNLNVICSYLITESGFLGT